MMDIILLGGGGVDLYNQTQSRDSPEPGLITWLKLSVVFNDHLSMI